MDKLLFISTLLTISAFTKGDGIISVIDERESAAEHLVKPAFKSALLLPSQNSTTGHPIKPTVMSTLSPHRQHSSGVFPRVVVSSSVGSVLFLFLLAVLIYYCCCRNQTPEGFTQFNNENERNPLRRRSRWKNRRFFRRNGRPNQLQNSPEAGNSTHVTVQPVLTLNLSSGEQGSAPPPGDFRAVPTLQTAPPSYDQSMRNPPIPNEFINPPMPNQFLNPPMPSQYMNPQMPSQYMNPQMPTQFMSPPMPNNINNPSIPSPPVRARL